MTFEKYMQLEVFKVLLDLILLRKSHSAQKLFVRTRTHLGCVRRTHTQLNVCAVKLITHDLIHDFHFTFQAYTLPNTLNGICFSLFKFHT